MDVQSGKPLFVEPGSTDRISICEVLESTTVKMAC